MNIGVCGCGGIASWISDILTELNDDRIVKYGVASAFQQECKPFAEKWNWKKVYSSYDELMSDPAIDLVYVAVPNSFHYDVCMKAIAHGKNVLCEKPFAVNEKQTEAILAAAHEKGVFINEALWPAFLPSRKIINDEIASGSIGTLTGGELVALTNVMFLPRISKLELGGGALLDMGPYILGRLAYHFGLDVASVDSKFQFLDTGVDSREDYTITFRNGCSVICRCQINADPETEYGILQGTKGRIRINSMANPKEILVQDLDGNTQKKLEVPAMTTGKEYPFISGYENEFLACEKALREGKKECAEAPNEMTRMISKVMTELRDQAGLVFPFE